MRILSIKGAASYLAERQWLCCVVLIWASEFFEPKDNVLEGVEVRDLSQRRGLELRQQRRNRCPVEPFCDLV